MPIKKQLIKEGVAMTASYDAEQNITTFSFMPNGAIYDDDVVDGIREQLQKELQKAKKKGCNIDANVALRLIVGRMADYMILVINGQEISLTVDKDRLNEHLLVEATTRFIDKLQETFDGNTPEEMARDFTENPVSSCDEACCF
ncbi:hypothetical protein FWF89_01030 [Candidatus Saccharibacteria bacterium]|nr:hypothetical protein [Candidatus Saccharibacteria bacterium]